MGKARRKAEELATTAEVRILGRMARGTTRKALASQTYGPALSRSVNNM